LANPSASLWSEPPRRARVNEVADSQLELSTPLAASTFSTQLALANIDRWWREDEGTLVETAGRRPGYILIGGPAFRP
jgi:hypothetical protein